MFRIFDPFGTTRAFDQEFASVFSPRPSQKFALVNVYANEDDVVVTTEVPGIDPADIDLTVTGDTLTLKGERKPLGLNEKATVYKRERAYGNFLRTIHLPFNVDANKVDAAYDKGILKITLPRAESDKPRKISVHNA